MLLRFVILVIGLSLGILVPTVGPWSRRAVDALKARDKNKERSEVVDFNANAKVNPKTAPSAGITFEDGLKLVVAVVVLFFTVQFAAWLIGRLRDVLILVFLSIIVAIALTPTVNQMREWQIPRLGRRLPKAVYVFMIYIVLLGVLGGLGVLIVPQLIKEGQNFVENLPQYASWLTDSLAVLFPGRAVPRLEALGNNIQEIISNSLNYALTILNFVLGLVGGIFSTVLILVIALFIINDSDRILAYFVGILPEERQPQAYALLGEMGQKIYGWAVGTLILSAFVGGAATIGLLVLDMPYAFLLGLIAGLTEFIPFIGPWIGAAPAIALALFQPSWKLIAVALLYFAIQELEAHFLAPVVLGHQVRIPGLVVIIALIAGGALAGIMGALLAVPAAAVVQVLVNNLIIPEIKKAQEKSSSKS